MSEDRAKQLALILQAIDDAEMEFAEYKTDFKERMTRLQNEAAKLMRDILSGQMSIAELANCDSQGGISTKSQTGFEPIDREETLYQGKGTVVSQLEAKKGKR